MVFRMEATIILWSFAKSCNEMNIKAFGDAGRGSEPLPEFCDSPVCLPSYNIACMSKKETLYVRKCYGE